MNNIYQLGTLKKGSLSIQDYFQQTKVLDDILSFIRQPLRDSELISHILTGLLHQLTLL